MFDERGRFRGYRGVGRDVTAQMGVESQLRESRELFARIFGDSPIPMMYRRLDDGVVTAVNDAWCRFFGLGRDEVVGRAVQGLSFNVDPEAARIVQARVSESGQISNLELQVRVPNGAVRDILFSAQVVLVNGLASVISTSVDVTERNRAAAELAASRERFERLFRASPLPIAISGVDDGAVLDVNDAWTRTYGYAREEILGRNFVALGLWTDLDARRRVRDTLRAGGALRNFECRWRKKSGEVADVLLSAEVVELGGERVMLSNGIDVTEQRRAEAALRDTQARFAKIFQSSPVPVVISRLEDGRYLEVNDAWLAWSGHSRDRDDRRHLRRPRRVAHGGRSRRVHAAAACRFGRAQSRGADAQALGRDRRRAAVGGAARARRRAVHRHLRHGHHGAQARRAAAAGVRAALPRLRGSRRRIRLGDRRRRPLHLRVAARRAGDRILARGAAGALAARVHAGGRGRARAGGVRRGRARARELPQPRAPHDVPHRQPGVATGERRADRRRRGPAARLSRHRARHHRAQAIRGAHLRAGDARSADQSAEPPAAFGPPRAGHRERPARGRIARGDVHRPRSLQAHQRHARPRGRRRPAARGGQAHRRPAAQGRHAGPPRGRRVRGGARGPQDGRGRRPGRAEGHQPPVAAVRGGRASRSTPRGASGSRSAPPTAPTRPP